MYLELSLGLSSIAVAGACEQSSWRWESGAIPTGSFYENQATKSFPHKPEGKILEDWEYPCFSSAYYNAWSIAKARCVIWSPKSREACSSNFFQPLSMWVFKLIYFWLHRWAFLQLRQAGLTLHLWWAGFSSCEFLLFQSTGSRGRRLSSFGT